MPNTVLYAGKPQNGVIKISEADTETDRVIAFTGAVDGSVIRRVVVVLKAASDDVIQMWYYDGTSEFILAECVVPSYSGMENSGIAITPYDLYAEGALSSFSDSNGLLWLPVESGHQIRFSMKSSFGVAGEYCNFFVFGNEL